MLLADLLADCSTWGFTAEEQLGETEIPTSMQQAHSFCRDCLAATDARYSVMLPQSGQSVLPKTLVCAVNQILDVLGWYMLLSFRLGSRNSIQSSAQA